jgi:effector-binding domain-containing protein
MLWISENGYRPAGPGREIYLVSPESAQNPADYQTEVALPIADL